MSIRSATESDLNSITWISVAALPADPVCPYRFPYRHEYPEDHIKYTRIRYREYMAAGDSAIMVFECPSLEDPTVNKAVAFSIWQLPETRAEKFAGNEATEKKRRSSLSLPWYKNGPPADSVLSPRPLHGEDKRPAR